MRAAPISSLHFDRLTPAGVTLRVGAAALEMRAIPSSGPHLLRVADDRPDAIGVAVSIRPERQVGVALFLADAQGRPLSAARACLPIAPRIERTPDALAEFAEEGEGWFRFSFSLAGDRPPGTGFGIALLDGASMAMSHVGEAGLGADLRRIELLGRPATVTRPPPLPMSWSSLQAEEEVFGPGYRHLNIRLRGFSCPVARHDKLALRLQHQGEGPSIEIRPMDSSPSLFASWPSDMPQDRWGPFFRAFVASDGRNAVAAFAAQLAEPDAKLLAALLEALPRLVEDAMAKRPVGDPAVWRAAAQAVSAFAPGRIA